MSKTYRKRKESYAESQTWEYAGWKRHGYSWVPMTEHEIKADKSRYYQDCATWYGYSTLPKWYRNTVTRKRRSVDRIETYRELTFDEYSPNYDMWNCTSSEAWGYW